MRLACTAVMLLPPPAEVEESSGDEIARPSVGEIPPRAFSDEDLIRITRVSSVVQCQCPQHLASLLSSLSAFETYSEQCVDKSPEDAKLHAFLHRTSADCRVMMEAALKRVVEEEGIEY